MSAPTYVFTDAQKADIRRYCGYPVRGATASQMFGYRYLQQYGQLEFILNNMSLEEGNLVVTEYLPNLSIAENAIIGTSNNLDTDRAAVWYHNKKELRDRGELFNYLRQRLCNFIGIPPGDYFYESMAASQSGFSVMV